MIIGKTDFIPYDAVFRLGVDLPPLVEDCEYCNGNKSLNDKYYSDEWIAHIEKGLDCFEVEKGEVGILLYDRDSGKEYALKIKNCPMCGRRL